MRLLPLIAGLSGLGLALPASAQVTPPLVLRAVDEVCMAAHDDGMSAIRARAVAAGFVDAGEARVATDSQALILMDQTTFIYIRDFGPNQTCSIQINDIGPRTHSTPVHGATDVAGVMTDWAAAQAPAFVVHRGLHRSAARDGTVDSAWIRQTRARGDEVVLVSTSALDDGMPVIVISYQTQPMSAPIPPPPGVAAPPPRPPVSSPAASTPPAPTAASSSRAEATRGPFRLVEANASLVRHMAGPRVTARPTAPVDRWIFMTFKHPLSTVLGRQDSSAQLMRFDCAARTSQVLDTESFFAGRKTGESRVPGAVTPEGRNVTIRRLIVAACDPAAPIDGVAVDLATARRSAREMLTAGQTYP